MSVLGLSLELWLVWFGVLGACVGSFLNVAIHRLPLEDETVSKPRRSRCPSCKTELTWRENIPLLSWIVLRGKCRTCGWRIPARYPLVELLTAAAFVLVAWLDFPDQWDLALVHVLVLCGLIVATFVDFAWFEIPDEVSIGGIVLAPLASLCVPSLHANSWFAQFCIAEGMPARGASLLASLVGILSGGGSLWLIGIVGARIFKKDAMGFGDVKLLAAGGGFAGPGGAAAALVMASFLAAVLGLLNIARLFVLSARLGRARRRPLHFRRRLAWAHLLGQYLPFGPYLAVGIGIVLLDWNDVSRLVALLQSAGPP